MSAIRVLIVDDSSFFRKRLTEIIKGDPSLEVCGEAKDGKEGCEMAARLHPDVITMDVEMPVMDGIAAVKQIMATNPTPILMFSSLTYEGANSTFKALEAGAVDFMPKNFDDIAHKREDALNTLRNNIKAVAKSRVGGVRRLSTSSTTSTASTAFTSSRTTTTSSTLRQSTATTSTLRSSTLGTTRSATTTTTASSRLSSTSSLRQPSAFSTTRSNVVSTSAASAVGSRASAYSAETAYDKILKTQLADAHQGTPAAAMKFTFGDHKGMTTNFRVSGKSHDIIAIGSSTGGPIALQNIIPKIPRLPVPIIVVQHMPASFTTTFAQRLNALSQNKVVEAKNNDILEPGTCYIAPGGMQMMFERAIGKVRIKILKGDNRVSYHPCVDVSFASLAQIYGGRVLGMILTGMGSDGCEGCRLLKRSGSVI